MEFYRSIRTALNRINYILAAIGAFAVFAIMFVMSADVTARMFKWPLQGAVELAEVSMGLMIFLGWTYTQQQKRHIAIDILYELFPPWIQRFLNLINPIVGFVLMAITAWLAWDFAMYSKISGEVTENLELPVWPFKLSILAGAITFCLQSIFDFVDAVQGKMEA